MASILEFNGESDIMNPSSKCEIEEIRYADLKDLPFDDEEVYFGHSF